MHSHFYIDIINIHISSPHIFIYIPYILFFSCTQDAGYTSPSIPRQSGLREEDMQKMQRLEESNGCLRFIPQWDSLLGMKYKSTLFPRHFGEKTFFFSGFPFLVGYVIVPWRV